MPNAQEWLDQEYPIEKRNKITELDIHNKKLTGELALVGFNNLTTVVCWNNNLTNLDLSNCSGLNSLFCYDNNLTNLDLSNCSGLTILMSKNNQLTNLDLSNCSGLTWLDYENNYNLTGDLQIFNHLTKLKMLHIINTKLTGSLASLPASLTDLYCDGTTWETELTGYKKEKYIWGVCYDYQAWRRGHPELIKAQQLLIEQQQQPVKQLLSGTSNKLTAAEKRKLLTAASTKQEQENQKITQAEAKLDKLITNQKKLEFTQVPKRLQIESSKLSPQQHLQKDKLQDQIREKLMRLQEQIKTKKDQLNQLISLAQTKLTSKSIFAAKQKEESYQTSLTNLLTLQKQVVLSSQPTPSQLEQIKEQLSKKLAKEEIQVLCDTQIELTKLEINLKDWKNQQFQTHIQIN